MELNYETPNTPIIKEDLPNATATLVLGILSIVFCWCCYLPGITMGIIAIVMGNKGRALYRENPLNYTETSFKNLNAGFICGIIGLSLTGISLLRAVVVFIINPNGMWNTYERIFESM